MRRVPLWWFSLGMSLCFRLFRTNHVQNNGLYELVRWMTDISAGFSESLNDAVVYEHCIVKNDLLSFF